MSFIWNDKKREERPPGEDKAATGDTPPGETRRKAWKTPRIEPLRPGSPELERARRALLGREDD